MKYHAHKYSEQNWTHSTNVFKVIVFKVLAFWHGRKNLIVIEGNLISYQVQP